MTMQRRFRLMLVVLKKELMDASRDRRAISTILFSAVFTYLIIWLTHGLLYRWPATRITDAQVEGALERLTLPLYAALERAVMRIGAARKGGAGERS